MRLVLGSNSPRRRALLSGLDIPFEAVSIEADESFPSHLRAGDIPLYIARAKAKAYFENRPCSEETGDVLLITADTIVWCDDEMLGKPKDRADAERMLRMLSGKTHQVFTGVCLAKSNVESGECNEESFVVRTDVTFRELTDEEITYYIDNYRPFDKAGAYGIQEWIGYVACTGLAGSYFNVVGFPVQRVYEALKKHLKSLK